MQKWKFPVRAVVLASGVSLLSLGGGCALSEEGDLSVVTPAAQAPRFGAAFERRGSDWVVIQVVPDSLASELGLYAGEVLDEADPRVPAYILKLNSTEPVDDGDAEEPYETVDLDVVPH